MTNTTDRILYVHKESKMYLTHTHYMELLNQMKQRGTDMRITINRHVSRPITLPLDVKELTYHKPERYSYNITEIPCDPDWEVEILPEFTKDELYVLAYRTRIDGNNIMDALNKKFEVEFRKTLERESEMYRELEIR